MNITLAGDGIAGEDIDNTDIFKLLRKLPKLVKLARITI